jgi:hypothetical protein
MTELGRPKRRRDRSGEPKIDAWPANASTDPSLIIERVKNAIDTCHRRGGCQDILTDDVVRDLTAQDIPHLLEVASSWITIVDLDMGTTGDAPAG